MTGEDCALPPAGAPRKPACNCGSKHGPAYKPGPHCTWECPLRYIQRFGWCPGYLGTGFRDPTKWQGANLTPAAKLEWIALIQRENLALPQGPGYRVPPFHL